MILNHKKTNKYPTLKNDEPMKKNRNAYLRRYAAVETARRH
jgi:hypothetical protein